MYVAAAGLATSRWHDGGAAQRRTPQSNSPEPCAVCNVNYSMMCELLTVPRDGDVRRISWRLLCISILFWVDEATDFPALL